MEPNRSLEGLPTTGPGEPHRPGALGLAGGQDARRG